MKSSLPLTIFLLVAYLSLTAKAFLPRITLASGESETKDYTLITRYGLLKKSILFFMDNPQYLRNETLTGFLFDVLRDLSEKPRAAKDTIDTISAKIKFINAINEIQSANVEMDSFQRTVPLQSILTVSSSCRDLSGSLDCAKSL